MYMRDWDGESNNTRKDIIQRRNNSTIVQLVASFLKVGDQPHPKNLHMQKKNKKKKIHVPAPLKKCEIPYSQNPQNPKPHPTPTPMLVFNIMYLSGQDLYKGHSPF